MVLSWLADLVGRPVDPTKSVDQKQTIIVLGAKVTADFRKWCVRASFGEVEAKHWKSTVEELVATKTLEPGCRGDSRTDIQGILGAVVSCSFLHTRASGNRETTAKEVVNARVSGLKPAVNNEQRRKGKEQASSSVPTGKDRLT